GKYARSPAGYQVLRHVIEQIWDDPRHNGFEVLDMRARDKALFQAPFTLVRPQTLEKNPALAQDPGVVWLARFGDGLDTFFSPDTPGA
ncbi:MAG: hypothetical protein ACOC20_02555, partial [Oceanicaulis sp.]